MTMVVKESEVEGALKSFTISTEMILRSFCQREPFFIRKESSSLAFWHHVLFTCLSFAENFICIISFLLHKAYEVNILFGWSSNSSLTCSGVSRPFELYYSSLRRPLKQKKKCKGTINLPSMAAFLQYLPQHLWEYLQESYRPFLCKDGKTIRHFWAGEQNSPIPPVNMFWWTTICETLQ